MEALLVKFSILAGVFGIVGLVGLAALLASVIWLIIRVANFDSIVPALLCVLASVALTVGGLFLSPAPEGRSAPTLQASWEAPVAAIQEQIGKLKDLKENAPWTRFLKGGGSRDGDLAHPDMERMDVLHTSIPPDSAAGQDKVLVDETLSGWHVRLAIPREWKDICVVENNGERLSFYQKASMRDYGGLVFFLSVAESPVDPEAPEFGHMDDLRVVVEKEGESLFSAGPTDVQYNYSITELSDEYDRMRAEMSAILETVEFERT